MGGSNQAGGSEAGRGSAAYAKNPTKAMDPKKTGVVTGQMNADGESMRYAVDGGGNEEKAERSGGDIAIEFIKVEEEALAGEHLPLTRREQVIRYFSALRRYMKDE